MFTQPIAPEIPAPLAAHPAQVFFTIKPDPGAALQIQRLTDRLGPSHCLTGQIVSPDRLHVSLNSLGPHDPWSAARAMEAVSTIRTPPFVVAFNRLASFGRGNGPRPLVLWGDEGVIGVFRLHTAIHAALADAQVVGRRERQIEPHVTLLRDRRVVPDQPIPPIRWTVRELLLIRSVRGEGHETLGRWPLRG